MISERVTQGMIDCWRVNYDLGKTPHDLHAFWGYKAPSGAVIALKAACDEIESLRKALSSIATHYSTAWPAQCQSSVLIARKALEA